MLIRFLLILVVVLGSAGCVAKKPKVAVEPAQGPQQKKASQRPYSVNGERYEPLASHAGFSQTGTASWYGKDFHGRTTSNGERYDMHAMTAAHKTLPLGVFVRVRNMDNGQEAVVRVNDRGPFVKGRVIDLSYAAAKRLGMDVVGTAPVRVDALGYPGSREETYRALENYDAGTYTVQIGAFKESGNAYRLSGEAKRLYRFSDVRTASVNGETFYRVYAGKYSSLRDAEKAEQEFTTQGYPGSFVVSLD